MLDVLGHIAALEIVRTRLDEDVASGAIEDQRAIEARQALEDHYSFALLGANLDQLLAHAGPSDAELDLLREAKPLYDQVRSFLMDFRATRTAFESVGLALSTPGALTDYNAARKAFYELIDRHDALVAALQAFRWRLDPPQYLTVHPRAEDVSATEWSWRDLTTSRRTGALVARLAELARRVGTAEALAFATGVLAGYAGNLLGSPYLVHVVSGPRRSHPYRDRLAAYAVGAWTRAAPFPRSLTFDAVKNIPVFGSPDNPALPGWLSDLLTQALSDIYSADVSTALPDLDAAYAQLVEHWRLLHSFGPLPPPGAMPLHLQEVTANTLTPTDLHPLGNPPSGPASTGPAATTHGSAAPNIFDPGPGQPPFYNPNAESVLDWIKEICLDLVTLPLFLVRVCAWAYRELSSSEPAPGTKPGQVKSRLLETLDQNDLDATAGGKGLSIIVHTLEQLDTALYSVAEGALLMMKLSGLLYAERDDLSNFEFRQFLLIPDEEQGNYVWPARPPAAVHAYIKPAGPPVEHPRAQSSGFAPYEKPAAFLVPGIGQAASMQVEGFDLVLAELVESADSPVRSIDHDLDADRERDATCWQVAPGTSIQDDPVSVQNLAYGEL